MVSFPVWKAFLGENVDKRDDNQNGCPYVLGTLFREYLGGTQKRRMRLDKREKRNFKILKWNNGENHILHETFIVSNITKLLLLRFLLVWS